MTPGRIAAIEDSDSTSEARFGGAFALPGLVDSHLHMPIVAELPGDALIVVCPALADAANAGAIVRNAAALGAAAVVFGEEGVSPFERKAVRASAGALFRVPVRVADGGQILRCLKAGGFSMVGALCGNEAPELTGFEAPGGRLALVIGSEAGSPPSGVERPITWPIFSPPPASMSGARRPQ